MKKRANYHLPGMFEFYEFYRRFLPLFRTHREYFYDWCEIASIYGAPSDCIWGGGRVENSEQDPQMVLTLLQEYGISACLTFSNSLLTEAHLSDKRCNALCELFQNDGETPNGVIVHSEILTKYLKEQYPKLYLVSSTTKVLTDVMDLEKEVDRDEFRYVVPDFRLNHAMEKWTTMTSSKKKKIEFLCNECCSVGCRNRKACYEEVSRKSLGLPDSNHRCDAPDSQYGYRFSSAKRSPAFISIEDIQNIYLPMGFTEFKIEGRGLGSAMILEFILYYLTKPEYQLDVREEIYLDNMLDLF